MTFTVFISPGVTPSCPSCGESDWGPYKYPGLYICDNCGRYTAHFLHDSVMLTEIQPKPTPKEPDMTKLYLHESKNKPYPRLVLTRKVEPGELLKISRKGSRSSSAMLVGQCEPLVMVKAIPAAFQPLTCTPSFGPMFFATGVLLADIHDEVRFYQEIVVQFCLENRVDPDAIQSQFDRVGKLMARASDMTGTTWHERDTSAKMAIRTARSMMTKGDSVNV